MVELAGTKANSKGCKSNTKYQKYADTCRKKYFPELPYIKVLSAPLLKITDLTQKQAGDRSNWGNAGCYGIAGYDEQGVPVIILDKGTCVFHPMMSKLTVLHELVHHYIGLDKGHGKIFYAQIRRIAALGALDKLV